MVQGFPDLARHKMHKVDWTPAQRKGWWYIELWSKNEAWIRIGRPADPYWWQGPFKSEVEATETAMYRGYWACTIARHVPRSTTTSKSSQNFR